MDDLEFTRVQDGIFETLEQGLLEEARNGKTALLVAVAVLTLPNGQRRIAKAMDDAGDGEGTAPVSHLAARAKRGLEPGEALELQLLEVTLSRDGSWTPIARRDRPRRSKALDDIFGAEWTRRTLCEARQTPKKEIRLSIAELTLAAGEKRVAVADWELGDGQARRSVADLLRRAHRLKLLRPGEKLERFLLRLTLSEAGWFAFGTLDPLS